MADSFPPHPVGSSQHPYLQHCVNMDAFEALNDFDLNDFSGTDSSTFSTPFDVSDKDQFLSFPSVTLPQPQMRSYYPVQSETNTWPGPRYHPEVGWYYPASPATHANILSPPTSQIVMMPAFSGEFAPMGDSMMQTQSPLQVSGPACNLYDPFRPPLPPAPPRFHTSKVEENGLTSGPEHKRKFFGLADFPSDDQNVESIRQRKRTRTSIDFSNRPIGTDLVTPAAGLKSGLRPNLDGRNKRKMPSLEASCICQLPGTQDSTETARVKRPRNAFILFRQFQTKSIMRDFEHEGVRSRRNRHPINQKVSQVAAAMWRAASPKTKARYQAMAEEEKARHARENPGYKYKPRGKGEKDFGKFGAPGCVCGAYEKNLAKWKREGGELIAVGDEEADASLEWREEFVPSNPNEKNHQDQTDEVSTMSHIPAMTDFGVTLAQSPTVSAAWQHLSGRIWHTTTRSVSMPLSIPHSPNKASASHAEKGVDDKFKAFLAQEISEPLENPSPEGDDEGKKGKSVPSLPTHTLSNSLTGKNAYSQSHTPRELATMQENEGFVSVKSAMDGKEISLESLFHDFDNVTSIEGLSLSEIVASEEERYDVGNGEGWRGDEEEDDYNHDHDVIAVAPGRRESR